MPTTRRTLLASASACSAAALGLAPFGNAAHAEITDLNDAINKAGRQRMLSQRVGKCWLALAHQADMPAARQVLDQSIVQFDRALGQLKAFAPSAAIRDTYVKLEDAWAAHKLTLKNPAASPDAASAVLQADTKVLALAHQGTAQYEAASGKPVGQLVNIAGRQRMLSQRMAKFYLAAMLPVDTATATAEIAKARGEFVAATERLRNAPQATQRIRQELQLADGQWVFFDAALQRMREGTNVYRKVSEVFVASENLLSTMDSVTNLYAALSA